MAFDFGGTKTHSNGVDYGNVTALNAPTAYTIALLLKVEIADPATSIFSKQKTTSVANGWRLYINTTRTLQLQHANADAFSSTATPTGALSTGQWYRVVVAYDATDTQLYVDGTNTSSASPTSAPGTTTNGVRIGSTGAGSDGAAIDTAHVMWWNVKLNAQEARSWPWVIPRPTSLKFWAPCSAVTEKDLIGGNAGSLAGTVNIVEHGRHTIPQFNQSQFADSIIALLKVISDSMEISEDSLDLAGLIKVLSESVEISEDVNKVDGDIQVVDDTINLRDGDSEVGIFDPAGVITETMSDGTVWTTIYPPFSPRTVWTED